MPILEQVLEKYPKEVKVVYKNFPLTNIHGAAKISAEAAVAANEQGKFWEFHDQLFKNSKNLTEVKITEIARNLNLDLDRFNKDRKGPKIQQKIIKDVNDAYNAQIKGVPAIFINGKPLRQRTFDDFVQAIEIELKKKAK